MVRSSRLRLKKMAGWFCVKLIVSDATSRWALSSSYSLILKCGLFLCVTDTPSSLYVTVPSSDCMALSDWWLGCVLVPMSRPRSCIVGLLVCVVYFKKGYLRLYHDRSVNGFCLWVRMVGLLSWSLAPYERACKEDWLFADIWLLYVFLSLIGFYVGATVIGWAL